MDKKIEIGKRIRELRLKNNLEQLEIANKLGYKSDTTVSKWESGASIPTGKKLPMLALLLNTSTDYILDGEQPQSLSDTLQKITSTSSQLEHSRQLIVLDTAETQLGQQNTVENSKNTVVELFSYNYYDHAASAGTGQYLNDVQVETIELPVDYDADFVIPVYGDSMEPKYHSGDYVFVKLSVELADGDIGVFEYYGDAYIKQLLINAEGAFLHSLNSKYEDIPVDRDSDFRIIGEVVGSFTPVEM